MRYDEREMRKGEHFLGNTSKIKEFPEDDFKHLKTYRMGEQAYDINGHKLSRDYCRPVFIHDSEYLEYDRIMMQIIKRINS